MGTREARVVGAGRLITVAGNEYTIEPLSLKQLNLLQMEALASFKKRYLKTYSENLELLGPEAGLSLLKDKIDEVARWDLDDLPHKTVYSIEHIELTDALKEFILKRYPLEDEEEAKGRSDLRFQRIMVGMLDRKEVKPETIKNLTGQSPIQRKTTYDTWWINGCFEGMIAMSYEALKSNAGITRELVASWPLSTLMEASQLAEEVTTPDLGNT